MEVEMLLAGDIGGTKTNLAVVSPDRGPREPTREATFRSAEYDNLETLIHAFLAQSDLHIESASLGVAGPVVGGRAEVTNLPWVIEVTKLQESFKLSSAYLLNDLQAIANAVPLLQSDELHTLNGGDRDSTGAIAVIAPGTGLGEAFLVWDGKRYHACPSEGGHADFAPTSELQIGLLRDLQARYGHVSYERVCSGSGLPNIYAYLRDSGYAPAPEWLAREIASQQDPTPAIVDNALDKENACKLCQATLETFISILGAEAGNLALKVFATGGVYLGGGIPPRIIEALSDGRFMQAFARKGRLSDVLIDIPVHVILAPDAPLWGAAAYGLNQLQGEHSTGEYGGRHRRCS